MGVVNTKTPVPSLTCKESEMATIGGVLLEPDQMPVAISIVEPEDFSDPVNGQIFEQLSLLYEAGKPVGDVKYVASYFKSSDIGKKVNVAAFIMECVSGSVPGNIKFYATEVVRLARLRRLEKLLSEAAAKVKDAAITKESAGEISDWLESRVQSLGITDAPSYITDATTVGNQIVDDMLESECQEDNEGAMIETGVSELDVAFGGVRESNYIVIAAAPGCGKSALAKQIGNFLSLRNRKILFVSLEMSAKEVTERLWAERCEIDGKKIANHSLDSDEKVRLDEAIRSVEQENFLISTPMGKDARWSRIAASAKLMKHTTGIDAMFLDYIQLIEKEHSMQSDYEKVTEASRGIKELARTLSIPIFVLSQFNSEGEKCQGATEPQLAHLRDSRAIGQDADAALFLQQDGTPMDGKTDVKMIVAKWRGDTKNKFQMTLEGKYTRIVPRDYFH